MSEANAITTQSPASSTKMLRAMVGIGVMCALLIVMTFELTLPRIERLRAEALEKAIYKVLPGTVHTAPFRMDQNGGMVALEEGEDAESVVYAGYNEKEELIGVAVEAAGQGYADIIRILYGYDPAAQKIIGFHVLESKETPGLGDKIEKDQRFLDNFNALDVALTADGKPKNAVIAVKQGAKKNPWEIDGITGATISSRAIGNIIEASSKTTLPVIYKNHENIAQMKQGQEQKEQHGGG